MRRIAPIALALCVATAPPWSGAADPSPAEAKIAQARQAIAATPSTEAYAWTRPGGAAKVTARKSPRRSGRAPGADRPSGAGYRATD